MPTPKNKYDRKHLKNQAMYQAMIEAIFNQAAVDAAQIGASIGRFDTNKPLSFNDYPLTKRKVDELIKRLGEQIELSIVDGVRSEWTLANNKNNELCNRVFGDNLGKLTQAQYKRYYSNNETAQEAFIKRKDNGLSLSDRVWRYTDEFKDEIEMGLDLGIRAGQSAQDMAKDLKQYLKHPDMLFRRVRDEHGNLHLSKRAADFHPGRGVYRSSYMNARRLAATETNIAYRTADHLRWQQMDFVVGIEIHLSNNHNCKGVPEGMFFDICDELKGKYPKDFKFTGWHPHCRCYATTILKTEDEMDADTQKILNGEPLNDESVNKVEDVPNEFTKWVEDNKERAKGWTTMPYFIRQNPQYIEGFEIDTYTKSERKFTRARKTSPAMKESLDIYLQSKYPEIPNTEKAAIYHYTRGDLSAYRQLNNQLRKGNLSEFNQAFSELLSNGIEKIPPIQATVYRAVRLNKTRLKEWTGMANTQSETVFKGFTSTTYDRSIAEQFASNHKGKKRNETDVLLIISGKTGRPIEDFSQFSERFNNPNQREVLFDKGMKVRFESVTKENGRPVIYITEL